MAIAHQIKHKDFKGEEEIKSGCLRQAKHQRSSGLFQNDSTNKVQSMYWELGTCSKVSKLVEYLILLGS